MRATGGQAERRTGSPFGGPLNLIHTTKSPNPRPATVSARFALISREPEGLSLGDVLRLVEGRLDPLSDLVFRRFNVEPKT
jgi:hypothetical protein